MSPWPRHPWLFNPRLSARRRWTVLAICALSMFLVGLDTTIVNVGLPAIGRGLGVGTRSLEWIVDAYTIVLASLLISSGALADRFGRRRVFQCGLVVFGAASLACALAPSLGVLVAARAVQGIGASMLSPVALAIVVNAMPDPRERAQAIGVWASVFGLSMAAGPVAGGALIAAFGWRSVFWINAPVIVAALVLSAVFVPESRAPRARRLDLPGQMLLTVVVCVSVGVLIEGPHIGWASPLAWAGYLVAAAAAVGFTAVERRRHEPLMDLALFRRPAFTTAVLGAVGAVRRAEPHPAAQHPVPAARPRMDPARGRDRDPADGPRGDRVCTAVGQPGRSLRGPATAAARRCVHHGRWSQPGRPASRHEHTALLLLAYLLIGIGFGFANAPITNTAVSGLPPARAGVAGAITSTARQVGSAIGIALAGGLVAGVGPAASAHASRPGWLLVAACGLFLLVVARAARPAALPRALAVPVASVVP